MPFEISTTRGFSAAHQLRLYDGSLEPVHGHNWRVRVIVAADKLDAMGVVMDFHELERLVDRVISPWHNHHLNEVSLFKDGSTNPSAENVAAVVARGVAPALPQNVRIVSVEVSETDTNSAVYRP